jgi:hypothetical protein
MSHEYDKVGTLGLDRERAKIHSAIGKFTNSCNHYGVSIVLDGWTNVKANPLINILGVYTSGGVFPLANDYSNRYKIDINIAKSLIKTIKNIGTYNVIQVISDH